MLINRHAQHRKGSCIVRIKVRFPFSAKFLPTPVMVYSCASVRDQEMAALFGQKMMSGTFGSVRPLRRNANESDTTCWLHTAMFCLSAIHSGG